MHESIIQNQIPVVLLEGTGGCCDLFAKCYHLYSEYHLHINTDPTFLFERNEEIKTKIYTKLKIINDEINDYSLEIEYFQMIYECIEKRMIFLNFIDFKVHSHVERDIDLAILQALLNGKIAYKKKIEEEIIFILATNSTKINIEQLNLALEWNRVDIVKSFIMKNDRDWTVSCARTRKLFDIFFCFRKSI